MDSSDATVEDVPRDNSDRQTDPKRDIAHRFGRAIKDLRKARNLSGKLLASRLGYTPGALWNIENEQTDGPPQLDRVLAAMEELGVNPELFWALLEGPVRTPPRPGADPETERQLNLMETLGEKILEMVQDLRQRVQGPFEDDESQPEG